LFESPSLRQFLSAVHQDSKNPNQDGIGIADARYWPQMANNEIAERFLMDEQRKLPFQKPKLVPARRCCKCGSDRLKIIFQVDASKFRPYFECLDCQVRERIS
jgi:hypothetical protein